MKFLSPNYKIYFIVSSLFFFSCHGPDDSDLVNIESEVITFYETESEEDTFPSIMVSTNGQEIVDEPKINADLTVVENKNETNFKIGIEIRGSSSQMFPKKSYGFESWDEDGQIVNYTWDFGDGKYNYTDNPIHIFTENGEYNVTLTVRDNSGLEDTYVLNIFVNKPPVPEMELLIIPNESKILISSLE